MTDKKSVFVSMGRPFTADQTAFRDDLINFLSQNGMTPRAINVTDYPTGSPLKGIFDVMRQCSGAIIVAFERSFYPQGVDRRHSNTPSTLADTRYTTPWSQIEATMGALYT